MSTVVFVVRLLIRVTGVLIVAAGLSLSAMGCVDWVERGFTRSSFGVMYGVVITLFGVIVFRSASAATGDPRLDALAATLKANQRALQALNDEAQHLKRLGLYDSEEEKRMAKRAEDIMKGIGSVPSDLPQTDKFAK